MSILSERVRLLGWSNELPAPLPGEAKAVALFGRTLVSQIVTPQLELDYNANFVQELRRAMLADMLDKVLACAHENGATPWVFYEAGDTFDQASPAEKSLRSGWSGESHIQTEQIEPLSKRIVHTVNWLGAQGVNRVLLILADIPDIPLPKLAGVLPQLDQYTKYDFCRGTNQAGRTVYLASSVCLPDAIFTDVWWGTPQATTKISDDTRRYNMLSTYNSAWYNITERADVEALCHRLKNIGTQAPHTEEFLRSQQLL